MRHVEATKVRVTTMTQEERDIITNFIARIGGGAAGTPAFGSVPSTSPALPPVDPAADNLISDQFGRYPEARYRVTQLAFVQEHALAEAQNRIKRLEWEVQQAQAAAQQAAATQQAAAAQPAPSRGFLGGLFGGGAAPTPGVWGSGATGQAPPNWQQQAPPPPQYGQGYQPGMFQRQGSGFLGSALTTAAGVAGGVVAGNVLMDMFSSHREGGFSQAAPFETGGSPWGNSGGNSALPTPPQADYVDQGSWTTPDQTAPQTEDSSWSQPQQPDPSSWTDNNDGGGGGGDGGGGDWGSDAGGSTDDNNPI